ncbi:hypothetical protein [Lagierella sp.]|uniref:hypothetical protein n=1 Tax=Lagierella sp. TaxID=2849657 RepID=UPI002615A2A0|nr:hypothetical protein [Lagierella sp.]
MAFNLQNTYILFFFVTTTVISVLLYKKASKTLSLSKLGPISLTFYFLYFLSYLGTTILNLKLTGHSMMRYMRHWQIVQDAFFILSCMMIVFPGIIILFNRIFKYRPEEYQAYRKKEIVRKSSERAQFITMVCATILCVAAVIFVFGKLGLEHNPYLAVIRGDSKDQLAVLRNVIAGEFTGISGYIKNILGLTMTPFLSYVAYVHLRNTKEKRWLVLFIILFVFSNLMVFYNLQKATLVMYWLNFIILSIIYGDKVKVKYLVAFGLVGFLTLNLMYYFVSKVELNKLLSLDNPILSRLFITTPMGFLLHLEVFTYRMLPLAGASLPKIISGPLFGFSEVVRSSTVVMQSVNFIGERSGQAGVYNGLFLGEAYANFQTLGIWIAMFHVPIVFFAINAIFTRLPKTAINVSLFSYLTVALLLTLHGGYADFVFNMIWATVVIACVLMGGFSIFLDKFVFKKKEGYKDRRTNEKIEE